MNGETKQYSILIVPQPEDSNSPVSAVHLEIAGDSSDFYNNVEEWKNRLAPDRKTLYSNGSADRACRIVAGTDGDFTVPCDEFAALSTLLYYCAVPEATVREIRYRDTVYTDVSNLEILYKEFEAVQGTIYACPVRCSAKKDGRDVTVYFLGFDSFGYDPDPYDMPGQISCGLSGGIVEADEKRLYLGAYLDSVSQWVERIDEETALEIPDSYYSLDFDVFFHVFLETDGEDVTFCRLLNGKMCRMISKTKDTVIFHATTDDCETLAASPERDVALPYMDVIFRNVNGAYQYTIENRGIAKSKYSGVVFTPPRLPDPDSLTEESAATLYHAYLCALRSAFSGAETYEADGIVFNHIVGKEDRFFAKTEDFELTAQWISPLNTEGHYTMDYSRFETGAYINVLKAVFFEGKTEVSLLPQQYSLGITVNNPTQKEPYCTSLSELRQRDSFPGEELPERALFQEAFSSFMKNCGLYKAVKKAILRFGVHRLIMDPARLEQISREEMESLLYGDMVPDQSILSLALEMKNEFNRTGKIPNIALIGEAGTGKTSIAKKLGASIFHKEVREYSPSDLKGAYEGWTKYEVLSKLLQAAQEDAIFFVDEAYELMSDDFGREAVSLLLPLMTGRTKVDASTGGSGGDRLTLSVDFETGAVNGGKRYIKPGIPPIWIAGYEDEIRLMLNQNKGLYRRLKRVLLAPPTKDQLYSKLIRELEDQRGNVDPKKCDILTKLFKNQKTLLTRFFMWGAQPQNSPYFANYAGVESFLGRCMDGIDFDSTEDNGITGQMETIMASIKRDVKRQLDTVRRKGGTAYAANTNDAERIQMISDIETRFENLVGCENQIAYMQSIIDMLAEKLLYDRYHITVPKGALLLGPPGVGKTFIARAMAGELQKKFEKGSETSNKRVGFMSLSAPEITTMPVSFIGSIFDRAEDYDVCVIFIDEVDAIAKNRFENGNYSHFIELIRQMDGIEQRSNVFILAATNAYESLDPAFTRSGRIDKKLFFTLPDSKARCELAEKSIRARCGILVQFGAEPNEKGEHVLSETESRGILKLAEETAELTAGRTPGDIENIINTAFIMYNQELHLPRKPLEQRELRFGDSEELGFLYRNLYEAVERFTVGDPHPVDKDSGCNTGKNDKGRFAVSVHEVGHALVEILSGREPFEKITSLPRGDVLGYVQPSQSSLWTKEDFQIRIRSSMGGRVAEEIVYGKEHISTGASGDMEKATYWARMMVERLGFTEEFGFMALCQTTAQHLDASAYNCSETFREQSDQAVNKLLKQLYQETRGLLADKKELIETLAAEVVKQETMTGKEFIRFYRRCSGREA